MAPPLGCSRRALLDSIQLSVFLRQLSRRFGLLRGIDGPIGVGFLAISSYRQS